MKDIAYNTQINDIEFLGGDFRVVDGCGMQNAALIIAKSCADILSPQLGIGLEEIYPHIRRERLGSVLAAAQKQCYDDGAASVNLSFKQGDKGTYEENLSLIHI